MALMSFEEGCAAVHSLPLGEQAAALAALAGAAGAGLAAPGDDWTVFDPLECTLDLAGMCPGSEGNRVCLAVLDAEVPCAHR